MKNRSCTVNFGTWYTADTSKACSQISGEPEERIGIREQRQIPKFDVPNLEVSKVYNIYTILIFRLFMIISVSGQHISIGNNLQEYSKERVNQVLTKYFPDIINADIHYSKEGINFKCDIIVKYGSGKHNIVKSNESCNDIYVAFDKAMAKLEKQLRKYKSKLKNHHTGKVKISEIAFEGTKYVISSQDQENNNDLDDHDNPAIIAEKPVEILKLSVKEAVMKMDLENLPAVVFKNVNNDRINIVYYRKDGNISWVDYN